MVLGLISDADPGTWDEAHLELPLDPRKTCLAVQLIDRENVFNDGLTLDPVTLEFDGHFAYNVHVVPHRE